MPQPSESTPKATASWKEAFLEILERGSPDDQERILAFLYGHGQLTLEDAKFFGPSIEKLLLAHEAQVRYFARKTRSILENLGSWETHSEPEQDVPRNDEKSYSTKEILLKKMQLGSRYVAFEAMERLTESRDITLAEPLINFLESESDHFKVSFLVKRLGRIPSPDAIKAVESFLSHEDPRIVSNALEGLWNAETPHLVERFKALVNNPDNRIRANAIRALFKYSPEEVGNYIEEMLESQNVAWQDSSVFLLKAIQPPNFSKLRDLAINSRFAGIRLAALEIPTSEAGRTNILNQFNKEEVRQFSREDLFGLISSLAIAGLFGFFLPHTIFLSLTIAIPGLVALILVRNRDPFFAKAALSVVFLALGGGDQSTLMLIPILMVIWTGIGDPAGIISSRGRFFAALFGLSALVLGNLEISRYLKLSQGIENLSSYLGKPKPILETLIDQKHSFFTALFTFISTGILLTAGLHRWVPHDQDGQIHFKYYLFAVSAGMLIVLVCHLSYNFGVTALLATSGLSSPAEIIKFLAE